jgi:hypothetical protein
MPENQVARGIQMSALHKEKRMRGARPKTNESALPHTRVEPTF